MAKPQTQTPDPPPPPAESKPPRRLSPHETQLRIVRRGTLLQRDHVSILGEPLVVLAEHRRELDHHLPDSVSVPNLDQEDGIRRPFPKREGLRDGHLSRQLRVVVSNTLPQQLAGPRETH